jgi:hypothetical protein
MRFQKTSMSLAVCLLPGLIAVSTSAIPQATSQSRAGETGSEGCGRLLVYTWDQTGTAAIVVEVDQRMVQLGEKPVTLDLGNALPGVRVHRDVYPERQPAFDYCSDLKGPLSHQPTKAVARSGRLTLTVDDHSRATARLEDVVFESADGARFALPGPLVIVATVGGFAG